MPKKTVSANELRQLFLNYFREQGHEVVASSSLIPQNDPTLLFTNAGMVPFKDVFLGKEKRPYTRAASSQRCVRAGGKHNDLENVGYTARHHTFFEMLGNFSFGDYFKQEAIQLAWFFLTDILKLPPEKLWITVYEEDQETADIWLKELKIDPARFSYCGESSNFWSMGPTGPCGSCTEIFYDHGEHIEGGPPGSPDEDGDRFVEIWNLVFMQYDRAADGTLTPLPKPSVDTGMGLERLAAVMQGVHNNYDTDLFQPLIRAAATLAHCTDLSNTSLRVIADHIRSCSFLITDGVIPSNEGRGYVLRRIIRRALRHGHTLGLTEPFFFKLVKPLVLQMGDAYPACRKMESHIEKTLRQEEEQFSVTLTQGLKVFEEAVRDLKGTLIPGTTVFKLYDTHGFPVDLTADMARERQLQLDLEGFETEMTKQRERSRQASQFETNHIAGAQLEASTLFLGYEDDTLQETGKIIALFREGKAVDVLRLGETGSIVLDRTPFYAESGGQVGDQGTLSVNGNCFRVEDTQKQGQASLHIGRMEKGQVQLHDDVLAAVNAKRRAATVLNHTATHLLHHVLRETLGHHVLQKGSRVEPERLRFDFSHPAPLTSDELKQIEQRVNQAIRANHEAVVRITTPQDALKSGAMGLFEDKYGEEVRVIRFGDSVELCGGTHAHHTGDVGFFKITSEAGVAAGIRRVEAVTGDGALQWLEQREMEFKQKLLQSDEKIRLLEKELEQLKTKLAGSFSQDLATRAKEILGVKVLAARLDGMDPKSLRNTVDQLKNKLGSAVIALALVKDGKISVVAGVTADTLDRLKAGELVNHIAIQIGGKGGGRADMAEAGGNQPDNLDQALASVYDWVKEKLA
ncbi:MAG TPA: alanine--tRNA ligase [Gammaproteobacteria bacterium]|nr:alanine--tRNA ligase [Gammaproteobacteria bacterium]